MELQIPMSESQEVTYEVTARTKLIKTIYFHGNKRRTKPYSTTAYLLLFMGNYLTKPEPPARELGRGTRELNDSLRRLVPNVATPARRPAYRDTPVVTSQNYLSPRRNYPIRLPQYSRVGSLPMVSFNGNQKKIVLTRKHFKRSSVVIPPPDRNMSRAILNRLPPPIIAPPIRKDPFLWATEPAQSGAIKESYNKKLQKHDESTIFRSAENEMRVTTSYCEAPSLLQVQSWFPYVRRSHGSTGSEPTSEPQVANRLPSSLVSNPVRCSSVAGIQMSERNCIASSYSSLVPNFQKKRRMQRDSPDSSPSSCTFDPPEWPLKKASYSPDSLGSSFSLGGVRMFGRDAIASSYSSHEYNFQVLFSANIQPDGNVTQCSRSSSNSSVSSSSVVGIQMSERNAIASSYSSLVPNFQKRKRGTNSNSAVSNTPSSRSDTPEWPLKKAREDLYYSRSTPVKSDSGAHSYGQFTETPVLNQSGTRRFCSERRRQRLELVRRHDEMLPVFLPPPIPGYSVTSADYNAAKMASLRRLNALLGCSDDYDDGTTEPTTTSSLLQSSPFTAPASSPIVTPQAFIASSNPLLQSVPKMQGRVSSQASGAAVTPAQSSPPTVTIPNLSFAFPATSSSKMQPSIANPIPTLSNSVVTSGGITFPQPLVLPQPKSQSPKSGLLLPMLSKPENVPQPAFKPIFGAPPSSDSSTVSLPSVSTAPAASTVTSTTFKPMFGEDLKQPALPLATTFKPIFGESSFQPPASSASSSFLFSSNNSVPTYPSISGTNNTSNPTPVLPAPTSNATNPSSVTAFPFGKTLKNSTTTSTTLVLGSNPIHTSQVKPLVTFGQTPNIQTKTGFSTFGISPSVSTTLQSAEFGSTTSAFTATFGSNPNPTFPSNTSTNLLTSAPSESQASKQTPAPLPNFGLIGQTTFGNGTQPGFGSATQPAFGENATYSFGSTTSAATKATTFGSVTNTQASSTAPNKNPFGGITVTPFNFGGAPNTGVSFGSESQSSRTASSTGFNFAAAQSAAPAPSAFGSSSVNQNSTSSQNTTFGFGTSAAAEPKMPFGSTTPAFGQSTSAAGFTAPSFPNANPLFSPAPPSFSIGAGSKPAGTRHRIMARRQHTRKK
ncbi:LOW QUALITY PROTEIN: nuclear envelope pore membrane protein POM 121 [Pelodytes ibericus]